MQSECAIDPLPPEILDRLGNPGHEVELGTIRVSTTRYERQIPILSWRGYGIVSPGYLTTNGDPGILAKSIVLDQLHLKTYPESYTSLQLTFSYPKWLETLLEPLSEENHLRVTSALRWLLVRAYNLHRPPYRSTCRPTTPLCEHGQTCASTKRDCPCY